MDDFRDVNKTPDEVAAGARSALSGDFAAQFGDPPPKTDGTAPITLPGGRPLFPRVESPAPKVETPAPKVETPPAVVKPVDTQAPKVAEMVTLLKDPAAKPDQVMKKVIEAFRGEPDRDAMSQLAGKINDGLKGTAVSLDFHPYRNHRTNNAVTIRGLGRDFEVVVGSGTGLKPQLEIPPVGGAPKVEAPAPKVETPAPKVEVPPAVVKPGDDSDPKVTDVANTLRGTTARNQADVVKKVELAFKTEPDKAAMEDLARLINSKLAGTGIRVDVAPYRGHRSNMSVTVSGTGTRAYEVFIGPGSGRR